MRQSLLAVTLAFSLASVVPALAQTPAAAPADDIKKSAFTTEQRDELDRMMRQFVLDNPKAIITSVEGYYNKQTDGKTKQEGTMGAIPGGLYDDPGSPFVGPKDAKFQVVEFFDYNCGFCKQANPDLDRVIKEQPNIKFIFKELPILSESSDLAARWAMAANRQGKYLEFHNELMGHQGPMTEEYLVETGKKLGLDTAKLKIDSNDQEMRDDLQKNVDLARTMGVRGTPFFVVGKEKIPGAIGYSKFKELIARERDGIVATVPSTTPTEPAPAAAAANQPADPASAEAALDPSVQRDMEAVRAETKAMVDALTKKAEELQKQEAEAAKAPAAKTP